MSASAKELCTSATLGALGAFSAATAIWSAWAYSTPGDYFANGSSFVLPTLGAGGIVSGFFCWRTRSKKMRWGIVLVALLALAYIVFLPDGWWVHRPPKAH